jgi:hypothetical protein
VIAALVVLLPAALRDRDGDGNDSLGELRAGADVGWTVDVQALPLEANQVRLIVALRAANREPIIGASVEAELPGTGERVALHEVGGGAYDRVVAIDVAGSRRVGLRVRHGADHYAGLHALVGPR